MRTHQLLQLLLISGPLLILAQSSMGTRVIFPAESDPHERTYMSWPTKAIWGKYLRYAHRDLARIAKAIVDFEPVTFLVTPAQYNQARRILDRRVEIVKIPVNDLWARDTIPVFTFHGEVDAAGNVGKDELVGLDLNFNGWGKKQKPHGADAAVGEKLLNKLGIKRQVANITAEGGSFETDGEGTLLVTESSVINRNRNPGMSKAQIEAELKSSLGVEKIIWFKGVKGEDITDGHVDSIARFIRPGRVIITRPHKNNGEDDSWARASNQALEVLKASTDAKGRPFEIVELYEPDWDKIEIVGNEDEFVANYVNYYVLNGGVILPKFGDRDADFAAAETLRYEYPDREVVSVKISNVAAGGGGIHCATHELPA